MGIGHWIKYSNTGIMICFAKFYIDTKELVDCLFVINELSHYSKATNNLLVYQNRP